MDYVPGSLLTFETTSDKILDLQESLDWLPDNEMDVALLRRLGINGKNGNHARAPKHEWRETALRPREEVSSLAADDTTSLAVADSGVYQVGELLRCENEVMRITALADATHLTITRGWAGTTAAAHSSKLFYSLGMAQVENAVPGDAVSDTPDEKYNYIQVFEVPVEVSDIQMMTRTVDGNTLDGQLERRFIEQNRQLARACLYGRKTANSSLKIYSMDGIIPQITTNVTNVGGAVTQAAIDALILSITNAGGKPKILACSPYQKQKIDALDNNKQLLGKKERTGGGLKTDTWQTGVLNYDLEIVVDRTILTDQVLILDDEMLEIMPLAGNGMSGSWGTYNAAENGQAGKKQALRGIFTNQVHNQKAHGYLYGLT